MERGGEWEVWGAWVSVASTPALPRALLAELIPAFPASFHTSFISTLQVTPWD